MKFSLGGTGYKYLSSAPSATLPHYTSFSLSDHKLAGFLNMAFLPFPQIFILTSFMARCSLSSPQNLGRSVHMIWTLRHLLYAGVWKSHHHYSMLFESTRKQHSLQWMFWRTRRLTFQRMFCRLRRVGINIFSRYHPSTCFITSLLQYAKRTSKKSHGPASALLFSKPLNLLVMAVVRVFGVRQMYSFASPWLEDRLELAVDMSHVACPNIMHGFLIVCVGECTYKITFTRHTCSDAGNRWQKCMWLIGSAVWV